MLHYTHGAEELIKRLGNDAPLHCRETYTGAEFITTHFDILRVNTEVNYDFGGDGIITFESILNKFKVPEEEMNVIDKIDLQDGWSWYCFGGWRNPWIDFFISCIDSNGDIIFPISYYINPCPVCKSCTGKMLKECDAYQYKFRREPAFIA
jgi:hypothetical protein